jgi:protein TonB
MVRVLVFLALSLLLHFFLVSLHVPYMAGSQAGTERIPTVVVRLVDVPAGQTVKQEKPDMQEAREKQEVLERQEVLEKKEKPRETVVSPKEEKGGEGVSFVAEGGGGKEYLDKLKIKIFKIWEYPQEAVRKGEHGRVTLTFVLNDRGEVGNIGVLASSGSPRLDSAAVAAVKKAGPYGPFSQDIKEKTLKVTGNFRYVLD